MQYAILAVCGYCHYMAVEYVSEGFRAEGVREDYLYIRKSYTRRMTMELV